MAGLCKLERVGLYRVKVFDICDFKGNSVCVFIPSNHLHSSDPQPFPRNHRNCGNQGLVPSITISCLMAIWRVSLRYPLTLVLTVPSGGLEGWLNLWLSFLTDSCAYTLYWLLLISVFRQVAMMQMIRVTADALLPK